MSSLQIRGDTSGIATIQAPAVAGTPTLTLPTTDGTILTNTTLSPGLLINTQYFTTAGTFTYTPTAGTSFIIVEVQGAGGGGGSGNGTGAGPSGGAGAYARKKFTSGFSGATVVVGAKGAANVTTQAGTSSFAGTVICGGGYGSAYGVISTISATATGGDFNIRGALGVSGGSSGSPGVSGGWSAIGGCAGINQSGVYGGGGGNNGVNACTATGGDGVVIINEYA